MQQLTISHAALHPTALHGGLQQRHVPQDVYTWLCVLSSWAACELQPAGYLGLLVAYIYSSCVLALQSILEVCAYLHTHVINIVL
jgi:hypothetical protein